MTKFLTHRSAWARELAIVLLATALFHSCSNDEKRFTKLSSRDTGITFVNENHETEKSNILTYEYFYNGGGVALGDINNDGLLDVYLTANIYPDRLYLNKGNFEFEDITESSGTDVSIGWKTGVSMVDINADGYLDIYVCRSASPDQERRRNVLLINNGNNTFTDRAREYNLDDPSYSTQAAFFDFDRDNDLDVILLNHSTLDISNSFLITRKNSIMRYPHVGNRFLKNENGRFIDVSDSIGIYGPAENYGLGISLSDVDNDGWIDIYTGCDYTGRDKLLINREGLRFDDVTERLSHISKFTMGTDIADVNGDGWMDIFSADMLPEDNRRQKQLFGSDRYDVMANMVHNGLHYQYMRNMLHLNNGDGTFSEAGQLAGIANTDWSWSSLFADFDNDGYQDLFVSNGFKRDLTDNDFTKFKAFQEISVAQKQGKKVGFIEVIEKMSENKIPNYCFRGGENLSFSNVTDEWGLKEESLTHGVAYGDLDNDGDLDLVTNNTNDFAGVYRNNAEKFPGNNFLKVLLVSDGGNKNGLGARLEAYGENKVFVRENLPVRGFQSSVDPTVHFGLGAIEAIDSLVIRWPDGARQTLKKIQANQTLTVKKSSEVRGQTNPSAPLFKEVSAALTYRHIENDFVDFRTQQLLPRMFSREGPALASADVDNNGQPDIFVGGARGQTDALWIARNGKYTVRKTPAFDDNIGGESTDAAFLDADGDGDQDLYVVSGGYEFDPQDPALQDHLYLNDGNGAFVEKALPPSRVNGSCVTVADIENDGDPDLFVGAHVVPGKFPDAGASLLLINDGNANFLPAENTPPSLLVAGLVTDATWEDLNNDGYRDLIVVGEWMAVMIFINDKGALTDRSQDFGTSQSAGLWHALTAGDFDADGDRDLIVGNIGLNTQMRASAERPVTLIYDDFDNNGSIDPILNYFVQDKTYPYPTRDELTEQLPSFKKRFPDYKSYSIAQIHDVLNADELGKSRKLSVTTLESSYLRNDDGKFTFAPLPLHMQMAPLTAFLPTDIDGDNDLDLLTGGNLSATRARTGKMTGNPGYVFLNDGAGNFQLVQPAHAGISVQGDVKKIVQVDGDFFFAVNDGPISVYRKNPSGDFPATVDVSHVQKESSNNNKKSK